MEGIDYSNKFNEFLETLKEFSCASEDKEEIKKQFAEFISNKIGPLVEYQNKIENKKNDSDQK
ncbi:hypothetical protein KAS31_04915 [Candidatus Parcubacteria bacterium]|nr:hypothetical protein [Candidatus Parcubacteria bacterium]